MYLLLFALSPLIILGNRVLALLPIQVFLLFPKLHILLVLGLGLFDQVNRHLILEQALLVTFSHCLQFKLSLLFLHVHVHQGICLLLLGNILGRHFLAIDFQVPLNSLHPFLLILLPHQWINCRHLFQMNRILLIWSLLCLLVSMNFHFIHLLLCNCYFDLLDIILALLLFAKFLD